MRKYKLFGIGNGIMDILLPVSEDELLTLGVQKGTMELVSINVQRGLLSRFKDREPRLCSGGSAANTLIAFSQLGGPGGYACCLGRDHYGFFYRQEFEDFGIDLTVPLIENQDTGTSIIVITPDSERTMQTCLGVAGQFSPAHIQREPIAQADWLYVEGYLLANVQNGQGAVREALKIAKESGTKVAITFSDAFIVDVFGEALQSVVDSADLVFANKVEGCAFAKCSDPYEAFEILKKRVPNVVLTMSGDGALCHWQGSDYQAKAFPCQPVDFTGAGDMFAAGFLYGVTHGFKPEIALKGASYLAMKIISQVGARMRGDLKNLWNEAVVAHS